MPVGRAFQPAEIRGRKSEIGRRTADDRRSESKELEVRCL